MFDSVVSLLGEVLACGASAPTDDCREKAAGELSEHDLSAHALVERIAAAERLTHAVAAAQTRDIHALAQARLAADRAIPGVGDRLAGRTTAFEVGLACRVSPQSAASRILAARRLVEDHPELLTLAEQGRVSAWALRLALRQTDVLDPDQCQVVDAQLAADITRDDGLTPGQLEQATRRRVAAVDPEADERRCARARADRQVSIRDRVDGTATLWARLKAEESVAVWSSLDGHARARRGDGDPRSLSTLMCDTLVERVTGIRIDPINVTGHPTTDAASDTAAGAGRTSGSGAGAGAGAGRSTGPDPWPVDPDPWDTYIPDPYEGHVGGEGNGAAGQSPADPCRPGWAAGDQSTPRTSVELQVVLAASTLLGLDEEPGMLRGYGTIPAGLARQIADHADSSVLRRLVCDPIDGRLLAMDTRTRCYTGPSGQFIRWRDQTCRLSGADIRDGDHVVPYAEGGPTSVPNGQGLAKNPHVIREHPDIGVQTVTYRPDPAADPDPQRLLGNAQLTRLRGNAPDILWQMPTGHTYRRKPPPALGHGSQPRRRHRAQRRQRDTPGRQDPDGDDP